MRKRTKVIIFSACIILSVASALFTGWYMGEQQIAGEVAALTDFLIDQGYQVPILGLGASYIESYDDLEPINDYSDFPQAWFDLLEHADRDVVYTDGRSFFFQFTSGDGILYHIKLDVGACRGSVRDYIG